MVSALRPLRREIAIIRDRTGPLVARMGRLPFVGTTYMWCQLKSFLAHPGHQGSLKGPIDIYNYRYRLYL